MSSTSGIGIPQFQAPAYNEASSVVARIETQVGNIQSIFAEVQAILAELQALSPPVKGERERPEAFQARVEAFNKQLNQLNAKLEGTYRKLGQAQAMLQRLQSQDLPHAERRDAQRIQEAAKQATEALNSASKVLSESRVDEGATADDRPGREDVRIELRVLDRKIDIRLDDDSSFKDVIRAFALVGQIVGDASSLARRASSAVSMPPTPGSGLPPVGLP